MVSLETELSLELSGIFSEKKIRPTHIFTHVL